MAILKLKRYGLSSNPCTMGLFFESPFEQLTTLELMLFDLKIIKIIIFLPSIFLV
jgi:hypothetical protein